MNPYILHQKKEMAPHTAAINYQLKSEVPHYASLSAMFNLLHTALQIKNCSKSTSAIKVATMKNMDDFRYERKPSFAIAKSTLFVVSEMNGTQRKTLVSP